MRLRGDRSPSPGRKSGEREDLCAAGLATRGRLPDIRNVAVLDAAVAAAYGWPLSITDENALREALALNGRSSVTRGRRVVDAGVVVAGRDADRLSSRTGRDRWLARQRSGLDLLPPRSRCRRETETGTTSRSGRRQALTSYRRRPARLELAPCVDYSCALSRPETMRQTWRFDRPHRAASAGTFAPLNWDRMRSLRALRCAVVWIAASQGILRPPRDCRLRSKARGMEDA